MSRSKTGRRIKVLKSSYTTYEVDSAVRTRLAHIWCASSQSNDWCCVIAFQFFFFWGTGDTLFNWHFHWHLHDFLSALDTKFLPILTMQLLSFCVSWMDHNRSYPFCHSPWCLMWCANLFDMIVHYGQISSFMINPNGLYGHVPLPVPLSLVGSGFDPVYLA